MTLTALGEQTRGRMPRPLSHGFVSSPPSRVVGPPGTKVGYSLPVLAVLTRIIVDVGETFGVEWELSRFRFDHTKVSHVPR